MVLLVQDMDIIHQLEAVKGPQDPHQAAPIIIPLLLEDILLHRILLMHLVHVVHHGHHSRRHGHEGALGDSGFPYARCIQKPLVELIKHIQLLLVCIKRLTKLTKPHMYKLSKLFCYLMKSLIKPKKLIT